MRKNFTDEIGRSYSKICDKINKFINYINIASHIVHRRNIPQSQQLIQLTHK